MPEDKDLKRLVRARMAATGERYTQAKAVVDTRPRSAELLVQLLAELGSHETLCAAMARLKALPPDELRPLTAKGTSNADWRIRRACCRLLDDLDFTPETLAALERCLDDPEPRVRRAAIHSLTCQRCKPDGCVVDVRRIVERAIHDANAEVRKLAISGLTYEWPDAEWRIDVLRRVAESDRSEQMRALAHSGLANIEMMRRTDAARRALPADLQAKTERHKGKFVAVSEGRIIDAGRHCAAMARTARKHGHANVEMYWVAPD